MLNANLTLWPAAHACLRICLLRVQLLSMAAWLQVSVADVLVGHKADLASPEQLSAFEEWACSLWPPKLEVGCIFCVVPFFFW